MPDSIYEIKVTLQGLRPLIWRRFQVPADASLQELHLILQDVMGWTNSHLYQFKIGEEYYGEPEPDFSYDDIEMKDASKIELSHVAQGEKTNFIYEYDFGDSWEHEILIEKILTVEPEVLYPVCLAGKRNCPPEDCGGIWGYDDLLEIIRTPEHEDRDEMMDWLGENFDPEAFDVDKINKQLRRSID